MAVKPWHVLFFARRIARLPERSRAVGLFFATSLAARAVGILCQLAQVPIAVHMLGSEAFGLWMTLMSVSYLIAFADLGVGQGAQNQLAEAFASGCDDRARELWGSTLVFLCGVAALVGTIVAVAAPAVDFTGLFHLADPQVRADAGPAITLAMGLFCANFPLGLAQRLAYSRQKGWMHNIAQGLSAAGSLGGILIASHCHWRLPAVIAATQTPILMGNAVLLLWQLGQLGWMNRASLRCHWATMRRLLGLGAYFGVQQVLLTLMISLPQIVISTHMGAAAVTPYNLAQRLFNFFAIIQNAFMLPLWPAYTDAKARGEFGWIRRTLTLSLRATLLATIAPMAVAALFAGRIIALWVGGGTEPPSAALVWLLFLWNAAVFLQQPFGYLLAGLSEIRRLTAYAACSAAASAGLMLLFVRGHGQAGAVFGLLVGYLPFLLFGNIAEVARVLRKTHSGPLRPGLPGPAVAAAEGGS